MGDSEIVNIIESSTWTKRFRQHLMSVRPAAGPRDLQLLVENGAEHAVGRIWDGATGDISPELPCPVGYGSVLTPDGAYVLDLEDEGGSEVGHVHAWPTAGGESIDLTPNLPPYVLRGLEISEDGSTLAITAVDDDGHHLVLVPTEPWGEPRTVTTFPHEAWFAHLSADATLASLDTTEHVDGIRRPAVTVLDVATGDVVGFLNDLPAGPIRAVAFSSVAGDPRLLVATERSGYARPCVWNPVTGERLDIDLADLAGEVAPLGWDAAVDLVLLLHVDEGIQRLLVHDLAAGTTTVAAEGHGSYANPDVAATHPYYSASYLGPKGVVRMVTSRWDIPLHVVERALDGTERMVVGPPDVPPGRPLESQMVESKDGTRVQLWWSRPDGAPRGTVLEVHGGPNLVAVDGYSAPAQAWLDEGFAFASLNYRGSVTFGRAIREGFWGVGGDREIEDIEAAMGWLRTQGLADPSTSFITGASYGGHLTLLSLGRLPGLFAGGLAQVAMADWAAAFADMNPAIRGTWTSFLGGLPEDIPDILARFSAVNFVDQVRGSAWLSQGARDTRTPAAQAQRYADLLAAAGGDVVIEWYDAGHEPTGLDGPRHDQARMLELVERTLAGRPWRGDPTPDND